MIKSFKNKNTELIFNLKANNRYPYHIQKKALKLLLLIDTVESVNDLRYPQGNHLEKLTGDRSDTYSIRINKQYRICFRVNGNIFEDVEIVDYH